MKTVKAWGLKDRFTGEIVGFASQYKESMRMVINKHQKIIKVQIKEIKPKRKVK